jgi:hypothetical protein
MLYTCILLSKCIISYYADFTDINAHWESKDFPYDCYAIGIMTLFQVSKLWHGPQILLRPQHSLYEYLSEAHKITGWHNYDFFLIG